jgi:hypothetical protein
MVTSAIWVSNYTKETHLPCCAGNLLHTAVLNAVTDQTYMTNDTLKGHEKEVTTKKFSRKMNQSAQDEYKIRERAVFT